MFFLGNIEEYLYETIDDIQTNISNKEYEKVLVDLLSIHQYILKSINKMYVHTKNNANKKIACDNSTIKKSDMNNIAKKSIKHNNTNKKINNNVNKKIISDNNANKKINNNNANKKIINANTNIIRKRKNNVNSVNEESICNNVNKLKQD